VYQSCPDAPVLDAGAAAARAAWCATAGLFADDCSAFLGSGEDVEAPDAETLFLAGTSSDPNPNGLDDLPGNYAEIASGLDARGLGATPVFLTQYPDITRDEDGAYCGWSAGDDFATRQRNLLGIDTAEMTWAAQQVATPLSDSMAMSAAALGWRFVDGAFELFHAHGYCSTDGWVVRMQEAFAVQGQPWGMVHPNGPGHAAWAEPIAEAVPEPTASAAALAGVAALAAAAWRRGTEPIA
jgi:hypothetical protein